MVPRHQVIPSGTFAQIAKFIGVFDQITTREAWQAAARRDAPAIAQLRRPEVCFFSAWDFHLPPEGGCQLIEFNDNGSGFLFAAIINDLYLTVANLEQDQSIVPPAEFAAFNERIGNLVEQEARSFFENGPDGLFLILDDTKSLQHGKFRTELRLLRDLLRRRGWRAEVGSPPETRWDGRQLLSRGSPSCSLSTARPISSGRLRISPDCGEPTRLSKSTSRPTLSPMPRAATNGCWNGCRYPIGMTSSESRFRNARS